MKHLLFYILFFKSIIVFCQNGNLKIKIDSLLDTKTSKPFNGMILITEKGKIKYSKTIGYADIVQKITFNKGSQFVIGSVSKQFTAVLVLQEYDKGNLELNIPIKKYLPELYQSWADTVTVHHLITHMHGITNLDKPATFKSGTQYAYSQIGYDLLAKVIEKTSRKSFVELSKELFKKCKMKNTYHPDVKEYKNLVNGYTANVSGELEFETKSFKQYVAAGTFISTTEDLNIWNQLFFNGKLLKTKTMKILLTKQKGAVREHPLFGITAYGYGITVDTKDNILQLGQTGFTPGFVSMNFYYPKTKTSVIVLENIVYDENNLTNNFYYHIEILKIIRNLLKNKNE